MSSIENAKIQPAMDAAGHLVATNHCKRGAQLGLHVCFAAPPQPARTPLTLSLPLLALAAAATSASSAVMVGGVVNFNRVLQLVV
jgi:hypothetical protein